MINMPKMRSFFEKKKENLQTLRVSPPTPIPLAAGGFLQTLSLQTTKVLPEKSPQKKSPYN